MLHAWLMNTLFLKYLFCTNFTPYVSMVLIGLFTHLLWILVIMRCYIWFISGVFLKKNEISRTQDFKRGLESKKNGARWIDGKCSSLVTQPKGLSPPQPTRRICFNVNQIKDMGVQNPIQSAQFIWSVKIWSMDWWVKNLKIHNRSIEYGFTSVNP